MIRFTTLVTGFLALVAIHSAEAQVYSSYRYRDQVIVVPPGAPRIVTVTPWGYSDLLGGYQRKYPNVPQPTGHRITPIGPNGYFYEPVYNTPPVGVQRGATVVERPVAPPTTAAASVPATPQAMAMNATLRELLTKFRAAQYEDVVAQCDVALIDDPRLGAMHLLQSHALFALGRYDESAGALRRGLSVLDEAHWSLLVGERNLFYPTGVYDSTLEKLRQLVAAQPNHNEARLLLGYHLGMLGRINEAREQLNAVRQMEPNEELSPRLLRRWQAN